MVIPLVPQTLANPTSLRNPVMSSRDVDENPPSSVVAIFSGVNVL